MVVMHVKDGCEVFCPNGAFKVAPFVADQVDPTGAGDCFLGGFAAGIVRGLAVPDAALLGNFFGSIAVAQVGPPKLDFNLIEVCFCLNHGVNKLLTDLSFTAGNLLFLVTSLFCFP